MCDGDDDDDDMIAFFVILSMVHVMKVVTVILKGIAPLLREDDADADDDGSAICENARDIRWRR